MYDLILSERLATVFATVLLAALAALLAGASRLWLRGLMYSLAPSFGAAFYVVAFLGVPHPDTMDLAAGLLFEMSILTLFYRLLCRLHRDLILIDAGRELSRVLGWTIALQVLIALPNLASGGFGVFSEGSRIDYLSAGSLPKYFTYAGLLLSAVQASLIAAWLSSRGRLGLLGWSAIGVSFALSVLAGSKGGVFLWMLSIASLVDYHRARIPISKIVWIVALGVAALLLSSLVVADFFGLDPDQFINLAVSRFFLNNDARALAFDLRSSRTAEFSLFSESFRSLGNLVGLAPRNDPLGVLLYAEGLYVTNGNGANTSFMALVTYYFPIGYALLPAVLGVLGAFATERIAVFAASVVGKPMNRVMVISIWLASFLTLSQDFLAFQVLVPLAVLATFGLCLRHSMTRNTHSRLQHVRG